MIGQQHTEFDDPLVARLASLSPADASEFESRLIFSAGVAQANRQSRKPTWLHRFAQIAALLIVAVGSSALTWNQTKERKFGDQNVAASEKKLQNIGSDEVFPAGPVIAYQPRPTLEELLDRMLPSRSLDTKLATDDPDVGGSIARTHHGTNSQPTLIQLQRDWMKGTN